MTLTIVKNNNISSISVKRIYSASSSATVDETLSNGSTITSGDILTISVTASSGYRVQYNTMYYGNYTVTSNVTVSPVAVHKEEYSPFIWNGSSWRCQ